MAGTVSSPSSLIAVVGQLRRSPERLLSGSPANSQSRPRADARDGPLSGSEQAMPPSTAKRRNPHAFDWHASPSITGATRATKGDLRQEQRDDSLGVLSRTACCSRSSSSFVLKTP